MAYASLVAFLSDRPLFCRASPASVCFSSVRSFIRSRYVSLYLSFPRFSLSLSPISTPLSSRYVPYPGRFSPSTDEVVQRVALFIIAEFDQMLPTQAGLTRRGPMGIAASNEVFGKANGGVGYSQQQ